MNPVSLRYAKALLLIAEERDAVAGENRIVERYGASLAALAGAFSKRDDAAGFLLAPHVARERKKSLVSAAFPDEDDRDFRAFLWTLIDKKRIGLLPEIGARYGQLAQTRSGAVVIRIETARELDAETVSRIAETFRNKARATGAITEVVVDKSLLGGVRVTSGNVTYDGSVLAALKGISEAIQK
jgi:F-type H+-transporting ATPase subunit delta